LNNIIGLVVSVIYVCVIIAIVSFLKMHFRIHHQVSRKIIHIAISNWWLIAMIFFDHVIYAAIIPTVFLILNIASFELSILPEMDASTDQGYGVIYYPLSLLILVIFSFGIIKAPYIGLIGILILGYGDGLAALMGMWFGKKKTILTKTVIGSVTMFLVSLLITTTIVVLYNTPNKIWMLLIIPILATMLELYGTKGIDNLSVPIVTSLTFFLLLL
jgi:phytol kinase